MKVFGMSREEEMWEAVAQEHGDLSMRESFVTLSALEWADKTMLERVYKYLENEHPTWYEHFGDELKKAMED